MAKSGKEKAKEFRARNKAKGLVIKQHNAYPETHEKMAKMAKKDMDKANK